MYNPKKTVASILLISIILLSGCIEDTDTEIIDNPDNTSSGMDQDNFNLDSMVMVENLPSGYEYLGSLPITDYNEFSDNICYFLTECPRFLITMIPGRMRSKKRMKRP